MCGGVKLSDYPYDVRCVLHTLQLSVKEAVYGRKEWMPGGVPAIVTVLQRAASLTSYLRSSTKGMDALRKVCYDKGIKVLKPQASIDVRWNSEFIMALTVYQIKHGLIHAWALGEDKGGIRAYSKSGNTTYQIDAQQWDLLEQVLVVLARVESTTRALEGSSNITLSKAYPEMCQLYKFMAAGGLSGGLLKQESLKDLKWNEEDVKQPIRDLKRRFVKSMEQRFPGIGSTEPITEWSEEDQKSIEPFLMAMVMDPYVDTGCIELKHPCKSLSSDRKGSLLNELRLYAQRRVLEEASKLKAEMVIEVVEEPQVEKSAAKEAAAMEVDDDDDDDVLDGMYPHMNDGGGAGGSASTTSSSGREELAGASIDKVVEAEWKRYEFETNIGQQKVAAKKNKLPWVDKRIEWRAEWERAGGWSQKRGPELQWWYENRGSYPWLSTFARLILAIPAASAGAERLFSGSGRTVNPSRSSLTPANVCMQVMLRDCFHEGLLDVEGYTTIRPNKRKEGEGGENEVIAVPVAREHVALPPFVQPKLDRRSERLRLRLQGGGNRNSDDDSFHDRELTAAEAMAQLRDNIGEALMRSAEGLAAAYNQYQDYDAFSAFVHTAYES